MKSLFSLFKRTFLRGSIRDWWIQKRARQIDKAYLGQITSITQIKPDAPQVRIAKTPKPLLKNVLYIGNCMWEHEQIFPELRNICNLNALDVCPVITGRMDAREAALEHIRCYADDRNAPDPDLIFLYLRPSLLSDELFSIIRERWPCPVLGLNLDDRVEFFPYGILLSGNDNYAQWIHHFDLNLTSSLTAVDWYSARGAQVKYLPQGFRPDPRFLNPPTDSDFRYRFSFVGSVKPERENLIRQLAGYGMQPTLFGRGWEQSQWAEDPQLIFRSSQINLGIGYALASAKIANAKGRDIECPAVGACYLTTYHWELAEMFEIGKEVLCYRNFEELVEMLTYYGKRPDLCLKIAQAAHKRAHAEHTWEMRLRWLFTEMGFRIGPFL